MFNQRNRFQLFYNKFIHSRILILALKLSFLKLRQESAWLMVYVLINKYNYKENVKTI